MKFKINFKCLHKTYKIRKKLNLYFPPFFPLDVSVRNVYSISPLKEDVFYFTISVYITTQTLTEQ